ncbi:OadG family protein [Candidatus Thioglobus sp.]|jgi:oxaloacetate decarboxylase gamma subunit|uniref:OadG family protein n=1 Tax=Candidatus Thioglobus sp. TaxID=2026721 RepID=UPI001DCD7D2B|nr:OadG family protein [Candidatus Thioglobus sp.]MBT3277015.1 OadG family protein [Candidatus Thioglobus sp.]MBT4746729.1 OadG family protein [Candidatus Thioglobus sp.]MBT5164658.1 OadG family protein [Candidatus Thioglobus sp.]MBT6359656.1 OadG family protein [Candidatus Thioglobus sp.]MBT7295968.1 OadG family protein [Candidatus Thioglobus sp.]
MEQADLLTQALNLTMFGMGFVFLFLTLLVFVTKLMSVIIQKLQARIKDELEHDNSKTTLEQEIDEETKFVIEQAIKMHRGA